MASELWKSYVPLKVVPFTARRIMPSGWKVCGVPPPGCTLSDVGDAMLLLGLCPASPGYEAVRLWV